MKAALTVPVSVVILADRLDDQLRACISSVAWAAERLVVDGTSGADWSTWRDRYQLTIVPGVSPVHDFAQLRNQAMTLAAQPWVLFLDSDEVFCDPDSAAEVIGQAIARAERHEESLAGFWLCRNDVFWGQLMQYGEGAQWQLRLVHRDRTQFQRPVHEVAVVAGKTERLLLEIHHQAHSNISDFLASVSRYAEREAEYRIEQHRSSYQIWWQLLLYPFGKFLYTYLWLQGWRDGAPGLVYSLMMAIHSLAVRVFWYEKVR